MAKKKVSAKNARTKKSNHAKKNNSAKSRRAAYSPKLMEDLKQFARSISPEYLRDHNITSVGIGLKKTEDKPTKDVSIQFTVARKVVPELLEAIDTKPIPKFFNVKGVKVPTDVQQRTFEASFRIVAESVGGPRKTRIDPILPGVSVANKRVSAGTIGCITYDAKLGTPYILSNWHVLHGPSGQIGDDVVQPGPHDDNRVDLNRLGKLVRSHLGVAGDCAIATIEDREFESKVLDLGVGVSQIGEPELGDKVIKSGRTTSVTHGIVSRIHVTTKIDYGGSFGDQLIGGFEIEPDPDKPSPDGEISMGGDSGSLWLFKNGVGNPTDVMAGLHFAGEGQGDPNEHAVACYARSIFEKLEIALTPPAPAAVQAAERSGYSPDFLDGHRVEVPKLSRGQRRDVVEIDGSDVIPYTHFSLAQSKSRRFCYWVAWNIDGGRLKKISRKGIPFKLDPRLPVSVQAGNDLYADNRLDRGHIARRADLVWGSQAEAKRANVDSFFFPNITPQMDNFNQSSQGGLWGSLEDAVFEEADVDNLLVSVFGGPMFRDDDREYRGIKIPREFFKTIVFVEENELKARSFVLSQNLDQLEVLDLQEFRVFQVTLSELEQRCGFAFPENLRRADHFAELLRARPEAAGDRKPLESLQEIVW